jgi:hypothetical protein
MGTTGGALDIPFDTYKNVSVQLNANSTLSLDAPSVQGHFQLRILHLGGPFTVDLPSTVFWQNATIYTPSGSGQEDVLNFFYDNSGRWLCGWGPNWAQVP